MTRRPKCIDEAMARLKTDKEIDEHLRYMYREESIENPEKHRPEIFAMIVDMIENAGGMWRKEMGKYLREDGRPNEVDAEMIKASITEDRWLRRVKLLQQKLAQKKE